MAVKKNSETMSTLPLKVISVFESVALMMDPNVLMKINGRCCFWRCMLVYLGFCSVTGGDYYYSYYNFLKIADCMMMMMMMIECWCVFEKQNVEP
jgi:hypothetical protein